MQQPTEPAVQVKKPSSKGNVLQQSIDATQIGFQNIPKLKKLESIKVSFVSYQKCSKTIKRWLLHSQRQDFCGQKPRVKKVSKSPEPVSLAWTHYILYIYIYTVCISLVNFILPVTSSFPSHAIFFLDDLPRSLQLKPRCTSPYLVMMAHFSCGISSGGFHAQLQRFV